MRREEKTDSYFSKRNVERFGRALSALLEEDEIPSTWKNEMGRLHKWCLELVSKCEGHWNKKEGVTYYFSEDVSVLANLLLIYSHQLDWINWYIKASRKKLKRFGRTIRGVVEKAEKGSENAFLALVSVDPRWQFEPWAKKKIEHESMKDNLNFLSRLGDAIKDKKKKLSVRRGNAQLMKQLKSRAPFGHLISPVLRKYLDLEIPRTTKELHEVLVKEETINPDEKDYTLGAFKKVIRRSPFNPSVSKTLVS